MDKTRKIIRDNKDKFPNFDYYIAIIENIESNIGKMPDIAIEGCKSLIEGISKTILIRLNIPYSDKGRNADSPAALLKKVLDALSNDSDFEVIYTQSTISLVTRMAQIRNERGDISHGRSVPKILASDKDLAELIAHTTDGVVSYLLKIIFSRDWSYLNEPKFEDNTEFNDLLDSEHATSGIIYSKALFDQDIISYKEQLKDYLSEKEENKK